MASTSSHETSSSRWFEFIQRLYPEALTRTYTVPSVHFNKVPLTLDTVPGTRLTALRQRIGNAAGRVLRSVRSVVNRPPLPPQTPPAPPQVLWPQESQDQLKNVQDSDLEDDAAQARVICNLEELGRHLKEVMFILSQFKVENYLNKSQYQVAVSQLPHPSQLDRPGANFSQCEFDVLIIHRQYVILIGEIKSVGHNHTDLKFTQMESDAAVMKKVRKSFEQLIKLKEVVGHVVGDIAPQLAISLTLFLVNINRAQLQRILAASPQLEQDACRTLGLQITDLSQAVKLCCCADDLSDRQTWWHATPGNLTKLTTWWQARMNSVCPAITDQLYLDIVARFVGPASSIQVYSCTPARVEVGTEGQAVAELGKRLSCLVLTPQQWGLMSSQLPLVNLIGPPGTGKTVVLVMIGVGWVQNSFDTYIVSTHPGNFAISKMIAKQITETVMSGTSPTPPGTVHFRYFDLMKDGAALLLAVQELSAAAQSGARIIMDEADFNTRRVWGQRTHSLVTQLLASVPGLHLWCAGVNHRHTPPGLQVEVLTLPLRSAPAVLREVQPAIARYPHQFHSYSNNGIPAPGDGQRLQRLRHQGGFHTGQWPVDCPQCGKEVANELCQLGVGIQGSNISYRDVFILTRSSDLLQDEVRNEFGIVTSQASAFVDAVRGSGMPVCVLWKEERLRDEARWMKKMEDVATATTDQITVAHRGHVHGLERKVVVWLQGRRQDDHCKNRSDANIDDNDRLYLVTRCTTQLMVVDVPPPTPPSDSGIA